jgi:phage terminase large subunit GpA-like protein
MTESLTELFEDDRAARFAVMEEVWNESRKRSLRRLPSMTLPAWADTYRRLSTQSSNIGGPWRTSRVEVARGPMMAVTERGVRDITCMTCTQLLKTSLLENVIGYFSHLDPCPMLLTEPKEDSVRAFSKERLVPMAKASPVLTPLLGSDRQHGGASTFQYRDFPGGFLAMESAGSPTNLAMRAIRITLADEVDKYETTKEGDPLILLEERTATFVTNSLHLRCCSPTLIDTSRIYKSYNEGDQRRPYVACPHCGQEQILDFFKHVQWSKSEEGEHFPFTAAIYCEGCGAEWAEAERMRLVTTEGAIKWRQTRPFICCGERQDPRETKHWEWSDRYQVGYALCTECNKRAVPNRHASFQAGKMLSPFTTVVELASKWILSKDDPESKQTFYNTQLGLPFETQMLKKIEPNALLDRREQFAAPVPNGVLVLTAGVDVQGNRLEVEVVGWGMSEESWSIATVIIEGDPASPITWDALDKLLLTPLAFERGGEMVIRGTCVDSGGSNTQDVYAYCRPRIGRNVWAIKGGSEKGGQWNPVWPVPKILVHQRTRNTGYKPIILGVNAAKEAIRQKLLVEQPGPGYCHFRIDQPAAWFDQLTAEDLVVEKKDGFSHRKWVPKRGRANEALDCRVYAYAALQGLIATRKLKLERLAQLIDQATGPAEQIADTAMKLQNAMTIAGAAITAAKPPAAAPAPAPRVRRSSWMT